MGNILNHLFTINGAINEVLNEIDSVSTEQVEMEVDYLLSKLEYMKGYIKEIKRDYIETAYNLDKNDIAEMVENLAPEGVSDSDKDFVVCEVMEKIKYDDEIDNIVTEIVTDEILKVFDDIKEE